MFFFVLFCCVCAVFVCGCVGVWVCGCVSVCISIVTFLVLNLISSSPLTAMFPRVPLCPTFLIIHYTSGTGKGGILKRFFCCLFFGLSSSVARSTFYSKTLKKKKSKSPFLSLFLFFLSPSLSRKAILLHRAILFHNNCVYRSHIYASNKSSKK